VHDHALRWIHGAQQVLEMAEVQRRLGADATVSLRQQGTWHIHPAHTTIDDRSQETGGVLHDAAAYRDDHGVPLGRLRDHPITERGDAVQGLGVFGGRQQMERARRQRRQTALAVKPPDELVDNEERILQLGQLSGPGCIVAEIDLVVAQLRPDSQRIHCAPSNNRVAAITDQDLAGHE
jgi:hypothetical protein